MKKLLILAALVVLSACSGGMQETETAEVSAESAGGQTTATTQADTSTSDSAATTQQADEQSESEADYNERLSAAVVSSWSPPNRPGNVGPRSARVTIFLGPRGVVNRWEFRRRATHELFNRTVEEYLTSLSTTSRQFPLPRRGTPLFDRVLRDGVVVQFTD